MKVENTPSLKIKLKGEDAENFKTAIKTISESVSGFKNNALTDKEHEVIKKLVEKL